MFKLTFQQRIEADNIKWQLHYSKCVLNFLIIGSFLVMNLVLHCVKSIFNKTVPFVLIQLQIVCIVFAYYATIMVVKGSPNFVLSVI